jgi:SAM-dependent methyltransferase
MQPVDYEPIAASYDRRYSTNRYDGIAHCLGGFLSNANSVAEVGCGTGHWLALASSVPQSPRIAGLDRSAAMLSAARGACPGATLVQGSAERLPWREAAFDRVFCVNALHHFPDPRAFYHECARVLRPGGAFLTIGLDPHAGGDQWWIYDYFPGALVADRQRYPSAPSIRAELSIAGFKDVETRVAQHLPAALSFNDARAQGCLERNSTSQLLVIDDAEWARGLQRLVEEQPTLHADLRLYATAAWRR